MSIAVRLIPVSRRTPDGRTIAWIECERREGEGRIRDRDHAFFSEAEARSWIERSGFSLDDGMDETWNGLRDLTISDA